MCGIAGFLDLLPYMRDIQSQKLAEDMANSIMSRGPDDLGSWCDPDAGIAIAHRRLSILDLSPAGHQPMRSACGRYMVVFNGEIYNHLELRHELERSGETLAWRGHSDTETLLAAVAAWGMESALKKFIGMFAFALWDCQTRTLTLARDRLGEKPLYYGWQGSTFLFGSELKALKVHPSFNAEIDRQALALFLRHNYVPAPYSIYRDIFKLLPGTYVLLRAGEREMKPKAYWSARLVAEVGQREFFPGTEMNAVEELQRLLSQSIAGQMIADVPLGAFLSGGLDSSTIVALMQAQSKRAVKTFTIGFLNEGYNEAEQAKAVARHLGTEHTELYVTPQEAMAVIPRLPVLYDEPFADSSQIPTFLVAQLARRHVTVSLSGDGGDELFGGYNRYSWATNIWRSVGCLPRSLRLALAGVLTGLPPQAWNAVFQGLAKLLPTGWRYANPGDKLHKLAEVLPVRSQEEMYRNLVSLWKQPGKVVIGGNEHPFLLNDIANKPDLQDFSHRMMYLDLVSYLPDDILAKVDRAAMGVSLETRVPFLDHRLVEFAWRLPLSMKIRNGQGKWILRQVLYKQVPKDLVERPKMGFGIPLDVWLRGPLREWAEVLLTEDRLRREGFFNPAPIREKWAEHLSGRRNWSYLLWSVLMFQAWLEANS